MMRWFVLIGLVFCAMLLAGTFAQAQFETEKDDFSIARIRWGTSGNSWRWNRQWDHDWPQAEINVMTQLSKVTTMDKTYIDDEPVELSDPRLFEFTFAYMCEVQYCVLTDEEAKGLREYLLRGGFLMVDDSWNADGLQHFAGQLRKAFPDRSLEHIDIDHPVFHSFYDLDKIPVIQAGRRRGGGMGEPQCYGLSDDSGRLMVLLNWDNDIGDGWEWAVFDRYDGIRAYKLGINYILYAMTH